MGEALVLTLDIFVNASVAIDWLAEHDRNTSLKALSRTTAKQMYSQIDKIPESIDDETGLADGASVAHHLIMDHGSRARPDLPETPISDQIDVLLDCLLNFKVGG
jgi:hypothetical protein